MSDGMGMTAIGIILGAILIAVGIATGNIWTILYGLYLIGTSDASISALSDWTALDWVSTACLIAGFIILIIFLLRYQRAAKCLYDHMVLKYENDKVPPEALPPMQEWFNKKCNYTWRIKF